MSPEPVITLAGVGKAYRIWATPGQRLTSPALAGAARFLPGPVGRALRRHAAAGYRDFHALAGVDLEVAPGEAVGIIGRNGSGKSTLLQIVAGTLQPTSGTVRVRGRVAALLELGSGFNPEFTGRENVLLNAAVLGFSRAETEARFDEIAAFADIGDFIDQPVKTYSSGMLIRLAFAVAVAVEPDVLVVDEALSVGDVFFQQKCVKRVREMLDRGVSLLFVSHDIAAVQGLCRRAVLLVNGRVAFAGAPDEAGTRYFASAQPKGDAPAAVAAAADATAGDHAAFARAHNLLPGARARHGSRVLELVAASAQDRQGRPGLLTQVGEALEFTFVIQAHGDVRDPQAGLNLYDRFNTLVFAAGNHNVGRKLGAVRAGDTLVIRFRLGLEVQPGDYTASLIVSEESTDGPNSGMFYDVHEGIGPIMVRFPGDRLLPFYGVAKLPLEFTYAACAAGGEAPAR